MVRPAINLEQSSALWFGLLHSNVSKQFFFSKASYFVSSIFTRLVKGKIEQKFSSLPKMNF